jgi:hypothetical protein
MRGVLEALAEDLPIRRGFDLEEAFIDGSFAPAKKGVSAWARPTEGKEPRSWPSQTAMVFQLRFAQKVPRHMR